MQLSKRLRAVADFVTPQGRLADVGTDHAYVPICLMEEKKISGAIAMDIVDGPLQRARRILPLIIWKRRLRRENPTDWRRCAPEKWTRS